MTPDGCQNFSPTRPAERSTTEGAGLLLCASLGPSCVGTGASSGACASTARRVSGLLCLGAIRVATDDGHTLLVEPLW